MRIAKPILALLDHVGPLPWTLEDLARAVLPAVPRGRALADSEKATLVAMAEVLLAESPVPISPREAADNFERFLILGRSKRGWRCRLLLTLVEYAPVAVYGRPLQRLAIEERRRWVRDKLMKGGFPWSTCAKVRYLAYAGAYGHPRANAATGFVPFVERPRALRAVAERGAS